jgi:hypothetical protein
MIIAIMRRLVRMRRMMAMIMLRFLLTAGGEGREQKRGEEVLR